MAHERMQMAYRLKLNRVFTPILARHNDTENHNIFVPGPRVVSDYGDDKPKTSRVLFLD